MENNSSTESEPRQWMQEINHARLHFNEIINLIHSIETKKGKKSAFSGQIDLIKDHWQETEKEVNHIIGEIEEYERERDYLIEMDTDANPKSPEEFGVFHHSIDTMQHDVKNLKLILNEINLA
jgi:chromosome segregation ATPase